MTATTPVPPEVAAYLDAVREALGDMPGAERDDLLAEVEASLVETVSETGGPIAPRLGSPHDFAAELRAAAGLHELGADAPRAESRFVLRTREAIAHVWQQPRVAAARGILRELTPIWWLVRGYVAVEATALLLDVQWAAAHRGVPAVQGDGEGGVLLIAAAVAVSIWLGLRARRRARAFPQLAVLGNVVLALAALPVVVHLTQPPPFGYVQPFAELAPAAPAGLALDGVPVTNVYPYTRDGRLLHDVLLYDSAGRALDVGVGSADPHRRLLRTAGGRALFNSFPIRYYEPGTMRVARPNAAPAIRTPRVVTPRLVGERPRR